MTKPPKHLKAPGRDFWKQVVSEFELESGSLEVLARACEALDRLGDARTLIEAEGAVIMDRFGQKKLHPAAVLERDSRAGFLAAMRALGLDLEPLADAPGRPAKG